MSYCIKFNRLLKLLFGAALLIFVCSQHIYGKQILIFDAGSSGTRAYLFDITNTKNIINISEVKFSNQKITPGIANFSGNSSDITNYFSPLIGSLKNIKNISNIPVYFYATAGMRLLPNNKQQEIYNKINNIFKNNNFKVKNIRTISGDEEALFDWLSINYLEHNFINNNSEQYAVLDMGGASTQIAFDVPEEDAALADFKLNINNKKYNIYTKSLLGAGKDEALKHIKAESNSNFLSCSAGSFNYSSCKVLVKKYLQSYKFNLPVNINNKKILGFSGFYYTFSFFDANNLTDFFNNINTQCHQPYDKFSKNRGDLSEKYIKSACFDGVYEYVLLTDFYNIPDNNNNNLIISNKNYNWAEGAALDIFLKNKR